MSQDNPTSFNPDTSPARPPAEPTLDLTSTRSSSACKRCRARRIRCIPDSRHFQALDAGQDPPPCVQCVSAAAPDECAYPKSKDRAAFSRQYVQRLEARVQALEQLCQTALTAVQSAQSTKESATRQTRLDPDRDYGSATEAGACVFDGNGYPRWTGVRNAYSVLDALVASSLCTPDIPSHLIGLRVDQVDIGHRSYFGDDTRSLTPEKDSCRVDVLPFPTADLAKDLVDSFFADIHPQIPILPEHRIRGGLDEVLDKESRRENAGEAGGLYAVYFVVFALGHLAMSARRGGEMPGRLPSSGFDDGAGRTYAECSLYFQYASSHLINHLQVQATTLLAFYHCAIGQLPRAWLLAGQAVRTSQDLGAHRNTVHPQATLHNRQIRLRGWWGAYSLERYLSMILGRSCAVEDVDIDAPYPDALSDRQLQMLDEQGVDRPPTYMLNEPFDCSMSGFISLVKLSRLAGQVSSIGQRKRRIAPLDDEQRDFVESAARMDRALRDWYDDMPRKYKADRQARAVRIVSEAMLSTFAAVRVVLHAYVDPDEIIGMPSYDSADSMLPTCFDVSRQFITDSRKRMPFFPPGLYTAIHCQYIFSAAIIMLACQRRYRTITLPPTVWSPNTLELVESSRHILRSHLTRWPTAGVLLHLLDAAEAREDAVDGDWRHPKRARVDGDSGAAPSRNLSLNPYDDGMSWRQIVSETVPQSSTTADHPDVNILHNAKMSFVEAFKKRRAWKRDHGSLQQDASLDVSRAILSAVDDGPEDFDSWWNMIVNSS